MRKGFFALLLISAFVSQGVLAQTAAIKITGDEKKIAEGVTAKQLSDYLYFVASDEMEGRDTPSRGLDTTAKFIAMNLSTWGFKPAGDNGSYFQKIALHGTAPDASKAHADVNGQQFSLGGDFIRLSGSASNPVSGSLVFGGSGWLIRSKNIDTLKGLDLKGKIVVLYSPGQPSAFSLASLPAGISPQDLTGQRNVDWLDPIVNARQKGAAGIIIVASGFAEDNWGDLRDFYAHPGFSVEKFGGGREQFNGGGPLAMLCTVRMANMLFAGETSNPIGSTAEVAPFNLAAGKTISVSIPTRSVTATTQNVVALWEGSDPALKNEMIAIGAHYDHIGLRRPSADGDRINNGADDDGSGTVSVLSIAEALAKAPKRPKRSVLFVWHCGEEKGLWGSEYFNKFPTVDLKNVISQLNIDMIGRSRKTTDTNPENNALSGENAIYVIGSQMMSSTLGSIVSGTNAGYLNMGYDYKYDDPKDPERFFFRSDHFNYALSGIPITFWFDGVHEDYHQPGDEPQKIDYNKMEKVARTVLITLWKLSELKERPKVDKQLPPELAHH